MNKGTDVVVSFDTTGSMFPCLSEVRRKVIHFVNDLFDKVDDLRIGIITHGDYCDFDKLITSHPLTDNKNHLMHFISSAPQTNGGDSPEAYEYVLKYARVKYDWRKDANKILILIADDIPHEVGYNTNILKRELDPGRLEQPHYNTLGWRLEARTMIAEGIKIYPVQAMNKKYNASFYNDLAFLSGTPKLDLHQFSEIIPLLTVVIYSQQSDTLVQEYGNQVQSSGQMTRTMADIFDAILGTKDYLAAINAGYGKNTDVDNTTEWHEVDPSRFQMLHVDEDIAINEFVRSTGATFRIGRGFYELTKPELIQERKEVVLRDKRTGYMFSGNKARDMIGMPYGMRGKVYPKETEYDVFIQSTSANRKLIGNTRFLYEAK